MTSIPVAIAASCNVLTTLARTGGGIGAAIFRNPRELAKRTTLSICVSEKPGQKDTELCNGPIVRKSYHIQSSVSIVGAHAAELTWPITSNAGCAASCAAISAPSGDP